MGMKRSRPLWVDGEGRGVVEVEWKGVGMSKGIGGLRYRGHEVEWMWDTGGGDE